MDRPTLYPLARELADSERLGAFAEELPGTAARVSEAALPLVLASLHLRLERPLVVLLPEDADARDAAEAAAWYLGDEHVALLPSRGVTWESGLEPPPHLVGERARALDVLAAGGLICASAAALAERLPPPDQRPARIELAAGEEPGIDGLAEQLALAGYERVERVEERGQFAVRGGIVDIFPTTGREPLRVELFGDEIEQIRAFSPFTQRALHQVERAAVYPAAERSVELVETTLLDEDDVVIPIDLVPVLDRAPDFVFEPDEVRRVWEEERLEPVDLEGASLLDPFPRGQPHAFEAQRPAVAARGLSEAEQELASFVRADQRVVVAFPHRGDALRQSNLLRRLAVDWLEEGGELSELPGLYFTISPARRGFVWRELGLVLLPDTQIFRKRAPRHDARLGRALQSFDRS
jgi:transcription-repair coupling factor (superfamily II helicase)